MPWNNMPCGIDLDFNALKDKIAELKNSAMEQVNETVAAAKAAALAAAKEFEEKLRSMIPEMPELPDMLPELMILVGRIEEIMANPTAEGLKLLAQLKTDFKNKYGDAISKAGADLDELIDGIMDGIDPCSLVPNIVTNAAGKIVEEVKDPLYAKTDALAETLSVETPAMKALKGQISTSLEDTEVNRDLAKNLVEESLKETDVKDEISNLNVKGDVDDFYESNVDFTVKDNEITESLRKTTPSAEKLKLEVKRGKEVITETKSVYKKYTFRIYHRDKVNTRHYDISLHETVLNYTSSFDFLSAKYHDMSTVRHLMVDSSYSGNIKTYDLNAHIKEIESKYKVKLHSVKQSYTYVDGERVITPVTYQDGDVEAFEDMRVHKFIYL